MAELTPEQLSAIDAEFAEYEAKAQPAQPAQNAFDMSSLSENDQIDLIASEKGLLSEQEMDFAAFKEQYGGVDFSLLWPAMKEEAALAGKAIGRLATGKLGTDEREGAILGALNDWALIAGGAYDLATKGGDEAAFNAYRRSLKFEREQFYLAAENSRNSSTFAEDIEQQMADFQGLSFFTDPSFLAGLGGKAVVTGVKTVGKAVGKTTVGGVVATATASVAKKAGEVVPKGVRSAVGATASVVRHPASHTIEQFGKTLDKVGTAFTKGADYLAEGGKVVKGAEVALGVGYIAHDYFSDGQYGFGSALALGIATGGERPILRGARRTLKPGHHLRTQGVFLETAGKAARLTDGRIGTARLLTATLDDADLARSILHGNRRMPFALTVKAARLGEEVLKGAAIDGFAGFLAGGGDLQIAAEEAFMGMLTGPAGDLSGKIIGTAANRIRGGRNVPLGLHGSLETTAEGRQANDRLIADWRSTRSAEELSVLDNAFDQAILEGGNVDQISARQRETLLAAAELDLFVRGFQLTSDGVGDAAIQFASADQYADALLVTEFGESMNSFFDDRQAGVTDQTYEVAKGGRLVTATYADLDKAHTDRKTKSRGVEVLTTDENGAVKPRILINVEARRAQGATGVDSLADIPQTLAHEVFHAVEDLRSPDDIDSDPMLEAQARMRRVLFGENGVFSEADVASMYDTYQTALGSSQRFDGLDDLGKDSARALVQREVGAEAFANFYLKTTRAGDQGLLDISSRITAKNRKADWDDIGDLYGIDMLGKVAKAARALGAPVDGFGSVNSSVFGFENTPTMDAIMAEYVTAKESMVQRLGSEETDQSKPVYELSRERISSPEFETDNGHLFEREADGTIKRDNLGRPRLMNKKMLDQANRDIAKVVHDTLAGATLEPGEVGLNPTLDDAGNTIGFSGAFMSDAQAKAVQDSPTIPASIKSKLAKLNEALKGGDTVVMDYFSAIKPGTTRTYSPRISMGRRVLTPMSLEVSKAGNFFINSFDVFQFERALAKEVNKGSKSVLLRAWNGDSNAMLVDLQKYLANHQQDLPGSSNGLGEKKRDLLNAFLGMESGQHPVVNPNEGKRPRKGGGSFVRRRRLDRIADIWSERNGLRLPVNWRRQAQNFFPNGATLDAGVRRKIDENPDLSPREASTQNADPATAQSARDYTDQHKDQLGLEDVDQERTPVINTAEARNRGVMYAKLPSSDVIKGVRESLNFTFGKDLLQEYYDDLASGNLKDQYGDAFTPAELETMLSQPEGTGVSPEAQKSYEALAKEVDTQYKWMTERDEVKTFYSQDDPYATSLDMVADVRDNKTMNVFSGGGDHPFFGESSIDKNGLSANEKFRAIHDYFGHASEGAGFGPVGEERAWYKHSRMFSPEARDAMSTETRGQNSWVNFGPHMFDANGWRGSKEHPRYLEPTKRPFALQKVSVAGPALSDLSDVATFSDDAEGNFQPNVEPIRIEADSPAGRVILQTKATGGPNDGASFNVDGTIREGKNEVGVTLASFNIPQDMARPQLVSQILTGWKEALEAGGYPGVFLLDGKKTGQASVDVNVSMPLTPDNIERAKSIGKQNGQQYVFQLDQDGNFKAIDSEGSGDPVLRHPLAIQMAVEMVNEGKDFNPADLERTVRTGVEGILLSRPRRELSDFPKAGDRQGEIEVHHWSDADRKVIDPQRFGTGIPGEEKQEIKGGSAFVAPVRSYWGTNAYRARGPEEGLGPKITSTKLPADKIFFLNEDTLPQNVLDTATEITRAMGYDPYGGHTDPTHLALAQHGFLGVTEGPMSDTIVTFWPYDTAEGSWVDYHPKTALTTGPEDMLKTLRGDAAKDLSTLDPNLDSGDAFQSQSIQRILADVEFGNDQSPLEVEQTTDEGTRAQTLLSNFSESDILAERNSSDPEAFGQENPLNDLDTLASDPEFPGNFQPNVEAHRQAYEAGDTETAQRLVDEAARESFGLLPHPLSNEDGTPRTFYHRTWDNFNEFQHGGNDTTSQTWEVDGEKRSLIGQSGRAFFFGPTPEQTPAFHNRKRGGEGERVIPAFLNMRKPLVLDSTTRGWAQDVFADGSKEFPLLISDQAFAAIQEDGYDGILLYEGDENTEGSLPDEILAFTPEQIKSAEPFTFDEQGELIPLDQRFDTSTADINFQPNQPVPADQVQAEGPYAPAVGVNEKGKKGTRGIPVFIDEVGQMATVNPSHVNTVDEPFISREMYKNGDVKKSKLVDGTTVVTGQAEAQAPALKATMTGLRPETYAAPVDAEWIDLAISDVADNYNFLYDLATNMYGPEIRQRMSQWYYGARRIADGHASRFNITPQQAAASLAAHSPQRHWFVNVALAERTADIVFNNADWTMSPAYTKEVINYWKEGTGSKQAIATNIALTKLASGKTLAEIESPAVRALLVRFASQEIHGPKAPLVLPEGDVFDGEGPTMQWGSFDTVAGSMLALTDPSPEVLTQAIGFQHKVRSFYGNIIAPGFFDSVTSDTHNVAAGILLPVGGSDVAVKHNFGSNATEGSENRNGMTILPEHNMKRLTSAKTGLGGSYALYDAALRQAAESRGIIPHEMQSITWEMIRLLFPDTVKKDKAFVKAITDIHTQGRTNAEDIETTRRKIVDAAQSRQPIELPSWAGRSSGGGGN